MLSKPRPTPQHQWSQLSAHWQCVSMTSSRGHHENQMEAGGTTRLTRTCIMAMPSCQAWPALSTESWQPRPSAVRDACGATDPTASRGAAHVEVQNGPQTAAHDAGWQCDGSSDSACERGRLRKACTGMMLSVPQPLQNIRTSACSAVRAPSGCRTHSMSTAPQLVRPPPMPSGRCQPRAAAPAAHHRSQPSRTAHPVGTLLTVLNMAMGAVVTPDTVAGGQSLLMLHISGAHHGKTMPGI